METYNEVALLSLIFEKGQWLKKKRLVHIKGSSKHLDYRNSCQ